MEIIRQLSIHPRHRPYHQRQHRMPVHLKQRAPFRHYNICKLIKAREVEPLMKSRPCAITQGCPCFRIVKHHNIIQCSEDTYSQEDYQKYIYSIRRVTFHIVRYSVKAIINDIFASLNRFGEYRRKYAIAIGSIHR